MCLIFYRSFSKFRQKKTRTLQKYTVKKRSFSKKSTKRQKIEKRSKKGRRALILPQTIKSVSDKTKDICAISPPTHNPHT